MLLLHLQYLYVKLGERGDDVKVRVTYTLDEELIERLRSVSDKTMIPQSRMVEQAIKEYLEKMELTER